MDGHGRSWTVMDGHVRSWTLMDAHRRSWTLMDAHGRSWTLMDAHGSSWTLGGRDGHVGRTRRSRWVDATVTLGGRDGTKIDIFLTSLKGRLRTLKDVRRFRTPRDETVTGW